mgnify:CR=1 FL=1
MNRLKILLDAETTGQGVLDKAEELGLTAEKTGDGEYLFYHPDYTEYVYRLDVQGTALDWNEG